MAQCEWTSHNTVIAAQVKIFTCQICFVIKMSLRRCRFAISLSYCTAAAVGIIYQSPHRKNKCHSSSFRLLQSDIIIGHLRHKNKFNAFGVRRTRLRVSRSFFTFTFKLTTRQNLISLQLHTLTVKRDICRFFLFFYFSWFCGACRISLSSGSSTRDTLHAQAHHQRYASEKNEEENPETGREKKWYKLHPLANFRWKENYSAGWMHFGCGSFFPLAWSM